MDPVIALHLSVEAQVLRVTVENTSDHGLRLWARNNSWGWSMFSLLLAAPGSDHRHVLTARPVRWTRNLPRSLKLPIGGRLDYELRRDDPAWEGSGVADEWLKEPIQVRVRLQTVETPEAKAQQIAITEAVTPPSLSMPPHA